MKVLGIDPGLEVTGYGLIEVHDGSRSLIEAGLIRTKTAHTLPQRLATVASELKALLTQHRPDLLVVEDLYSHYAAPKTAILMGHVRGVILSEAALSKIPVVSYLPTRVKKAVVGRGHAPKEQVARMVKMRLKLDGREIPSDVSDALAVALCHIDNDKRLTMGDQRR
jgi:crossover junction endodeoxyribonuclease RuvC